MIKTLKTKMFGRNEGYTEVQVVSQLQVPPPFQPYNFTANNFIFQKVYDGINAFDGIFSELTKRNQSNINDKGIIEISGNILKHKGEYKTASFSCLVNYSDSCDLIYDSENVPNSYICFDFKDHMASVFGYSIKSSKNVNPSYLTSWVIEGSNDNYNWMLIDSHYDDKSLAEEYKVCTFTVQNMQLAVLLFRYVRIRMTGKSSANDNYLELRSIEFFGNYYHQ